MRPYVVGGTDSELESRYNLSLPLAFYSGASKVDCSPEIENY